MITFDGARRYKNPLLGGEGTPLVPGAQRVAGGQLALRTGNVKVDTRTPLLSMVGKKRENKNCSFEFLGLVGL